MKLGLARFITKTIPAGILALACCLRLEGIINMALTTAGHFH